MMNDKNPLVASLLAVAKEWQKISMVKECIKEFNESAQKMDIDSPPAADPESPPDDNETHKEPNLVLEVYEDKEYDIEEVKYWNFISKKKQPKPDIIRTLVYKVPEPIKAVKPPAPLPVTHVSPTPTSGAIIHPAITPVSKSAAKPISHEKASKFSALHLTALDMAHYNHSAAAKVSLDDGDALDLAQFNPIGSNSLSEHFVPTSHNDVKSMLKDENTVHGHGHGHVAKRSVSAKKPLPDEIQPLKSLNSHQIANKKVVAPMLKKKIAEIELDEAKVRQPPVVAAVVVEKRGRGRPPKNRAVVPKKVTSDEDDAEEASSDGDESSGGDDEEFRSNPSKRLRLSAGRGRPPGTGRGRGRPPKEPKEVKEVKKVAVEDVFEFDEGDEEDTSTRRNSLRLKKEEKLDESDSNSKRMFFKRKSGADDDADAGEAGKRRSSLRLSRSDEDKASSVDSVVRPSRKYRSHLSSLSEAAKMIEDEENATNATDKDSELNASKSETRVTRSKAKLLDKSLN